MPDGAVKWLNPELLKTLVADNSELINELDIKNLTPYKVYEMFAILGKYNKTKK